MNRKEKYEFICACIAENGYGDIYCNSDGEIVCNSIERANVIADLLQAMGIDTVLTGTVNDVQCYVTID